MGSVVPTGQAVSHGRIAYVERVIQKRFDGLVEQIESRGFEVIDNSSCSNADLVVCEWAGNDGFVPTVQAQTHLVFLVGEGFDGRSLSYDGLGFPDFLPATSPLPAILKRVDHFADVQEQIEDLHAEVKRHTSAIGTMTSGTFEIQTPVQARNLTTMLSNYCPNPEQVSFGLWELLLNSIEHGNLEIDFETKTRLIEEGTFIDEIERRLIAPEFSSRIVRVTYAREPGFHIFVIKDQGAGFDYERYTLGGICCATGYHGRGIRLARDLSFDSLEYVGTGNEVTAVVKAE